jgi:hypothetical protein
MPYDALGAKRFSKRLAVHLALREKLLAIAEAAVAAWKQQQLQQPPRQLCSLLAGLLKFKLVLVDSSPLLLMLHVLHALRTAAAAATASSLLQADSADARAWLLLAGQALWVVGTAAAQLQEVTAAAAAAAMEANAAKTALQIDTEARAERRALQQLSLTEHWTPADLLQRCCNVVQLLSSQVDKLQLQLPGVARLQQQRKRLADDLKAARMVQLQQRQLIPDASTAAASRNGALSMIDGIAAAFSCQTDSAGQQQQQQQQQSSIAQQLVQFAAAACALLPCSSMCCNPGCSSLGSVGEKQLVSQSSTRCSACKQAQFCCRACQVEAWPAHKKVCKALAAAVKKEQGPGDAA